MIMSVIGFLAFLSQGLTRSQALTNIIGSLRFNEKAAIFALR